MTASNIYSLEPATRGVVALKTSLGDLFIELWPRECPLAVHNFCQLGVDGYYNSTIFHRVVKNVMIQGGDPTGTGRGGAAYDDEPFADEFHSRLKFRRRGLLAMASRADQRNSNGSQFFFTLDACEWLNGKHTIFGRIAGSESMFRLTTMGEVECGPDERPLEPPRILGFRIAEQPFDELIEPSEKAVGKVADSVPVVGAKAPLNANTSAASKNKPVVLSFDNEDDDEIIVEAKKIRTIHDVPRKSSSKTKVQKVKADSSEEGNSEEEEEGVQPKSSLKLSSSNARASSASASVSALHTAASATTTLPSSSSASAMLKTASLFNSELPKSSVAIRDEQLASRLAAFKHRLDKKP